MAIQKTNFHCEICDFPYASKEEASDCEKLCSMFSLINPKISNSYIELHRNTYTEFQRFLQVFKESNGFEEIPFQVETTKFGLLVKFKPTKTKGREFQTWSQIMTSLEIGAVFDTQLGHEIPCKFIDCFLQIMSNGIKKAIQE